MQGRDAQLLLFGVDVGANEESDEVKERDPGLLGEELLREGEAEGRRYPAHLHDWHEAGPPRGVDLVDVPGPGDNGHGNEVDAVLDGRNLR